MQVNEVQAKALAEKTARVKRRQELAYNRKTAPAFSTGRTLFYNLRARAREKGIPFDLTPEWIAEKLSLTHCEATNIAFKGLGNEPFGRTFDRVDSSKGYTMDNCWVTCWIYNRCKLNGTHGEVVKFAHAVIAAEKGSKT